ncbi:hypothetical protein [Lacinutrix algicola]|uniref:hypothetical protein n=1 Tax=Lacinutrix algicola TaxID=342954 RepID=UPI0006E2BEED|nr:hypothetical protein [Lacinutrix algicola]
MSIRINNTILDLQVANALIAKGKTLNAIKYIREEAQIGLKEAKDIADNLINDPGFYSGQTDIEIQHPRFDIEAEKVKLSKPKRKRAGHIIQEGQSKTKKSILLVLITCLIIVLYLYFK